MATLHFETDAGRSTVSQINVSTNELQSQLNTLGQRINSMVGSEWIGNSANQFQSEFQNWSQQLQQVMQNLETLRQRLETEIADWEQAASALN